MQKYKTMADFGGEGIVPMLAALVTAMPAFFPIILFFVWICGTGSTFYIVYATTGRKRFFEAWTAWSYIAFLATLPIVAQNTSSITFLQPYWVAFYIAMSIISTILLDIYK